VRISGIDTSMFLSPHLTTFGSREKLKKEGFDVNLVQLDVTDINSITAARDSIEKAEGKLDVLVNNAGIHLCSFATRSLYKLHIGKARAS